MRFIKLLSVTVFAASLLAAPAFAAEGCCPAKAEGQKKECCPAKAEGQKKECCPAKADGKCGEKSCPMKDGKPCEKANQKKADEKKK